MEEKWYVYGEDKSGNSLYTCKTKEDAKKIYEQMTTEGKDKKWKWKMMSNQYMPDIFEKREANRKAIKGSIIWFVSYCLLVFPLHLAWEYVDTIQFGSPQPSIMDTVAGIVICSAFASWVTYKLNKEN